MIIASNLVGRNDQECWAKRKLGETEVGRIDLIPANRLDNVVASVVAAVFPPFWFSATLNLKTLSTTANQSRQKQYVFSESLNRSKEYK